MAYKRHGRYSTSDPAFGTGSAGTAVATVLAPFPENGWVTEIIGHVGRVPGDSPTVEFDAYDTASAAPDDLTARTNRFTVLADMDSGGGPTKGDIYTRPITWTGGGTGSPLNTAMKAKSGTRFACSMNIQGSGDLAFGTVTGGADIFRDFSVASTPPSVFQIDQVQSGEAVISLALGYYQNTKPVATYTGPTGPITTATPTISGSFSDAEAVYGDRMTQYQIQVRNKATNVLIWNPDAFDADGAQKASGTFSEVYGGTTIAPGTTVQVSIRVADEFGTWSNWTSFTSAEMTYSQGGRVVATAPTGKQLTVSGLTFGGNYRHALMLAATNVRVRIRSALNGALIYESASVAKAVSAPATSTTDVPFTVTQASLSPSFALQWGGSYLADIQLQDSSGAWSGYYSAGAIAFTTDARPTIPSGVSPGNNSIITSLQQISFIGSDPDDASALLTPELRIAGPYPMTNGALPANVTGWTAAALAGQTKTFTWDGTDGRAALGSGKIAITASTAAAGTFFATENDTQLPVVVGETYTARISTKTSNANITPLARINWYNASNVSVGVTVEATYTPTINTWYDRTVTGVAPAGAVYAKVTARVLNVTANQIGNVWVDDASLDDGRRFVRTPSWNATAGRWEYTPTSTDFAAFGVYTIDARLGDGTLFSNWSTPIAITYANGPVFHFVRPVDEATVATTRTRMTWALDSGDQAQYKMEIRTASEGHGTEPATGWDDYIWASPWIVSTTDRDYQIPDGIGGVNIVDNENWYQARLHIKNALGIEGTQLVDFYVEFPPVREIPLSATLVPARFDDPNRPTQVLLTWPQTDYPNSQFEEYRITKRLSTQTPGQAVTIFRSSSPTDTRVLDDNVRSGNREYVYALTQLVTRDGDASRSERTEASVVVNFKEIVINDATFSGDFRVVCRQWADFHIAKSKQGQPKVPFGQKLPVIVFGGSNYATLTVTLQFIDDAYGNGEDYYEALEELHERGVPLMIRHPRGNYLFFSITTLEWDFPPGMWIATLEGIQNSYVEGLIL